MCVEREESGKHNNYGGHEEVAVKNNNTFDVQQQKNCTSKKFYHLPRRFETQAKPRLVACITRRSGSATFLLDCFLMCVHRLKIQFSRLTAELQLYSFFFLPSLHFSSPIPTLPHLSLYSYFILSF